MAAELNFEELEGLMDMTSVLPESSDDKGALFGATATNAEPGDVAATDAGTHKQARGEKKDKKNKKDKRKKRKRERRSNSVSDDASMNGDDDDASGSDDAPYKRSKFIIDAAESDDSDNDDFVADDDDEEGSAEEGFDENAIASRYEKPQKKFIFHEGDMEKSADELGREYEERDRLLRSGKLRSSGGGDDGAAGRAPPGVPREMLSSLRYASHMLPQDTDPKVFAVKCKPRMARALVARILNKCYAYRLGQNFERKKTDLGIISAFCLDHVKEYIYVEAYRKLFVENALNGLVGVFRLNITVVDPSELMQMMEKRPSNEKIRVGSFVRLRQRFYRMDLAQVTAIHQDGVRITCKVVPREDFVGKTFKKATTRLPPRFFAPAIALGAEYGGDRYRWGDLYFDKDGYLLKTVSARMVISGEQMEKPTTEELARFYNNNREQVREAIERSAAETGGGRSIHLLRIGDTVRVTSGQLRNTIGRIVNIFTNTNTALISCVVPGAAEPLRLRVELSACARHFAEGTHVIVEKGAHAGECGTVVKSWGDVVLLFTDRKSGVTELKVQANDCHQSNLTGSLGHSNAGFELFDLVAIPGTNAVGCVVCLNRDDVDVVTDLNEVRTLTYAQVKPVPRGGRQTTDRLQNVLSRGAEVTIQRTPDTPYNLGGEIGIIKHVFNRTLFVLCRRRRENAGIVALDAMSVLLTGGRTTLKQMAPPQQLPAPMRRPHNATKADISVRHESAEWMSASDWYEPSSAGH